MSKHNFVLAPWGNGIDTHRFWEILYSGSIPVTKKHIIYDSFQNIPRIQLVILKSLKIFWMKAWKGLCKIKTNIVSKN